MKTHKVTIHAGETVTMEIGDLRYIVEAEPAVSEDPWELLPEEPPEIVSEDPWEEHIAEYLNECTDKYVTGIFILKHILNTEKFGGHEYSRVAQIMKKLGWEKTRTRLSDGSQVRVYKRPGNHFSEHDYLGPKESP